MYSRKAAKTTQRLLIGTLGALGALARALTRMSIKQRSLTEGKQLTINYHNRFIYE